MKKLQLPTEKWETGECKTIHNFASAVYGAAQLYLCGLAWSVIDRPAFYVIKHVAWDLKYGQMGVKHPHAARHKSLLGAIVQSFIDIRVKEREH